MSDDGVMTLDPEFVEPQDPYLVRLVESQDKQTVSKILRNAGIKRNSQSFPGYALAKRLVFRGLWIDKKAYDRQLGWILEFLDLP